MTRTDLGPKQLAWLRRKVPPFKQCEEIALKVKREAEESRRKTEVTDD